MVNLEIDLINLFMTGESFSTNQLGHQYRDTTTIKCDGYTFVFKQYDINLKQDDFLNQTLITTSVSINNIHEKEIEKVLEITDDICWLLSYTQQSPISRYSYRINTQNNSSRNCSGIIVNNPTPIIEPRGKAIRNFLEQVYQTYIKIKNIRQLPTIIGYLCEANRSSLACEISLISHYVAVENLKHTFALHNQYEYLGQYFTHKNFPHLDYPPPNLDEYWEPKGKRKKYVHKTHGQVSSTEMTLRMFEAVNFNRAEISPFLNKRNKIIHEGILSSFGDENYTEQAIKDRKNVSDLLRKYLLTLLNYKGAYYLSRDRIEPSGLIT